MYTDLEKTIYNEYLKESRKSKNQPFKLRKDFSKLDETVGIALKRLAVLFEKHKEIAISDFFKAPYAIYSESETFYLKFYTTQKAITVYKIYMEAKK